MEKQYQICKKCIMDTSDPLITFDERGVCNHCHNYEKRAKHDLFSKEKLNELVNKIKSEGKDNKYDCIIGVSGGVDSTLVAYLVKKMGLRPLAVHVDNGWNSELSINNIENILKKLNIDLYTYVIDWEEFKDLQISFLKASVANAEVPTDHCIKASLLKTAVENNVKYIITGGNVATEAIMPESWGYDPKDFKQIKAIHGRFGKKELKNYPHLSLFNLMWNTFVKGIKLVPILNYTDYKKKEAKELIEKELDWRDYGGKHYESIYTRFFQGYILPKKFGFDKRRAHLSTLVNSGQMTREEALEEMKHSPYPTKEMEDSDKDYTIKKLGLTEKEFEDIMALPKKTYKDYPNDSFFFNRNNFLVKIARSFITNK